MNKAKLTLVTVAAALFTLLASVVASSACWWGLYQPEEPASLREQ